MYGTGDIKKSCVSCLFVLLWCILIMGVFTLTVEHERDGPHSERDGPHSERDGPHSERDGPHSERDGPYSERDGPHSERDGPQTPHSDYYVL